MSFLTEDNAQLVEGGLFFNYYDLKPIRISKLADDEWHTCMQYSLPELRPYKLVILDGTRICTLEHAERMGWISSEQVSSFRLEHECPDCWSAPCKCEGRR